MLIRKCLAELGKYLCVQSTSLSHPAQTTKSFAVIDWPFCLKKNIFVVK